MAVIVRSSAALFITISSLTFSAGLSCGANQADQSNTVDASQASGSNRATSVEEYCPDVSAPADRPADGTAIPPPLAESLRELTRALRAAMADQDPERVRELVCTARKEMGRWQGVAGVAGHYRSAQSTRTEADAVADAYTSRLLSELVGSEQWVVAEGSTNGYDLTQALRAPCSVIGAYLNASVFANSEALARTFRELAADGLDWLLGVQRDDGVFPFPDLRDDADAWLEECAADGHTQAECRDGLPRIYELAVIGGNRLAAAGNPPGVLVDGWFVNSDLLDPGGLQFDTGICGETLLHGYERLGDPAYLAAARAAGRWATRELTVPNWNYNAFSVGLLARLAALDPHPPIAWGDKALAKARAGVLPGAMEDGRWFDPHNARIVYHQILFKALVQLALVTEDPWVNSVLRAAHRRNVREFSTLGVSALDDAIEAYVLSRELDAPPDEDVLRMLVDASIVDGQPDIVSLGFWIAAESHR